MFRKSVEPLRQIWYFIADAFIEQGLEYSDEATTYEHISKTDLIANDPFHVISFMLVLQMLVQLNGNLHCCAKSISIFLLVEFLAIAKNWHQWPVHHWNPLELAPGDPLINHGFLELGVTIQTCLWIESCNVLCNSLSIKNGLILSDKVGIFLHEGRRLSILCKSNIDLGLSNFCNSLYHESHPILRIVKIQIQVLLVNEVLLFIVIMAMADLIFGSEIVNVPLIFIELNVSLGVLW